jgi:Cu(I)/Ag(I) efflux system membrane fusion protein
MKRFLPAALLIVTVVTSFWAGSWRARRPSAADNATAARPVLYYVDPMNPAHTSAEPGLAPCGMKMEPVYAEAAGPAGSAAQRTTPGTVHLSDVKQQLIGVRLAPVERKALSHHVRLLGRVAVDETRVYRINATIDGWVTATMPLAAGHHVKKDETLGGFYSTEFLSAGQALLFALNAADRVTATGRESEAQQHQLAQFNLNLKQYKDSLKNLGMGDRQIQEMINTRTFVENVDITSPVDGFIIARNVSDGQRFERGTELYRIADLSHVWILADLFEKEAAFVQPGAKVRVSLPRQPSTFTATVSQALPQFDLTARTLKLRLEADNPGFRLKPDMFVDIEFPLALPETVVVPAEALLDSGLAKTVFVEIRAGVFEPRSVETGQRLGGQVQILNGLKPDERIVVSGTFLLDSESRLKLAAAGAQRSPATNSVVTGPDEAEAKDWVCGMTVDCKEAKAAALTSEHLGRTYYFCGESCKRRFEKAPDKFLKAPKPAALAYEPAPPARPNTVSTSP